MKRIPKAWGTTIPILECPEVGLYIAEVQPGGYCSVHLHRFKWNRFYVRRGTLVVYWLAACGWNARPLADGEMMDVSAGIRHMFYSAGGCRLWESYVPAVPTDRLDPDDIVRFTTGGILNGQDLDDETPPLGILSSRFDDVAMSVLNQNAAASHGSEWHEER